MLKANTNIFESDILEKRFVKIGWNPIAGLIRYYLKTSWW